ncbi:MAG: carboxypeptidase-like regulatory domain-containing protein [Halobellus sp.]
MVSGLLLTGAGATIANAQTADPVTLTVSVVNQDGDPVSDAELTATWENGSTTETTASNGKAFVDVPSGANVTISVSHPEYIRNHPFVIRNASERDVTVPVYRRGRLSVVVADDDGRVAGARVVLRKDGRVTTRASTNDTGVFDSGVIEQGEYTVSVVKSGYRRNTTTVQVGTSTRTRIAIERGTVILTVSVRDPHFTPPRPVSNATVRIDSIGRFRTLAEGATSVSVPVNTELSVTVSKEGYEDATTNVRVEETDLRANVSTSRIPTLRLEPLNQRIVAGERLGVEVVDEYSAPVEGASVLLDGDPVGTTEADGRVTVPIDQPGTHTLVATKGNLRSSPVTVRAITEESETSTPTRTATPTEAPTRSDSETPGFTPLAAVLAIAASLASLALRRR